MFRPLATIALAVATLPRGALAAQARDFEITPSIGAYLPTGVMVRSGNLTIAQQSGLVYGVRLSVGAHSRAAVEMTLDLGTSNVLDRDPGQVDTTWAGRVLIMGVRVRYNLRPGPATTPYVSGGVAYLSPTGPMFENLASSGPALSFGVGLRVVGTGRLVGRLELSNYLYRRQLYTAEPSHVHDDFLLSAGVGVVP